MSISDNRIQAALDNIDPIDKTTPESAEQGDFSESDFEFENSFSGFSFSFLKAK